MMDTTTNAQTEMDAKADDGNEAPRFWYTNAAGDVLPETLVFGADTAQIVDEEAGGAIAYTHMDRAQMIVDALMDAAGALNEAREEIDRLNTYGRKRFGDEWWPGADEDYNKGRASA